MVDDGCGIMQKDICGQKMDSILEKLEEQARDIQAQKAIEESHARELFGKIDDLRDRLFGGGHTGTGINPRLMVVEVRTERVEKAVERQDIKFEKYVEERASFERKLVWGILAAIGTGILGLVMSGLTWLIGKVIDHG